VHHFFVKNIPFQVPDEVTMSLFKLGRCEGSICRGYSLKKPGSCSVDEAEVGKS